MTAAHARAALWWFVIAIWLFVLATATAWAGVRETGSLVGTRTVAVGDFWATVPDGATQVCTRQEFADGPPVVPYFTPWECASSAGWPGQACYWSAFVTVDGVEYAGHRAACFVEFWAEAAPPPDPPASGASGAVSCGAGQCLSEGTFEGWARVVAAFMVVVVWSLGIAHGRGAT